MDAIKNAASSLMNNQSGQRTNQGASAGGVTNPAGAAQTHSGTAWDKGIDTAQQHGVLPATGTQQGNMIDAGQKMYGQYNKGNAASGGFK